MRNPVAQTPYFIPEGKKAQGRQLLKVTLLAVEETQTQVLVIQMFMEGSLLEA